MDPEPIQIICGNCQKFFPLKTIVLHAKSNSKCKHSYSPEQISNLEAQSKKASAEKKRIKDAKRYLKKKEEAAKKYQEKKSQIAEKYDPIERAEKYQEKKAEIAEKYDPIERAEKYQEKKS